MAFEAWRHAVEQKGIDLMPEQRRVKASNSIAGPAERLLRSATRSGKSASGSCPSRRAGNSLNRVVAMGYGGKLRWIELLGVLDAEGALVNPCARGAVRSACPPQPDDLTAARRDVSGLAEHAN
jgi:hypothetical protein